MRNSNESELKRGVENKIALGGPGLKSIVKNEIVPEKTPEEIAAEWQVRPGVEPQANGMELEKSEKKSALSSEKEPAQR